MLKERSCGAIVWNVINEKFQVLLIKHKNGGHWGFPKGHVEKNETDQETAIREIFEETGLDVVLDTNFCCSVTYSPKVGVMKDVVYFSAKSTGTKTFAQESEVSKIKWVTIQDANYLLSYDTDKQILGNFQNFMNK